MNKLALAASLISLSLFVGGRGAQAQTTDIVLQAGDRIVWQMDGKERFVIFADKREDAPTQWALHIQEYGRLGCDDDSCWGLWQEILMWCETAFFPGEQCDAYYIRNGQYFLIYLPTVIK